MFESVAKFYKPVKVYTGPMKRDLPANRMAHLQERAPWSRLCQGKGTVNGCSSDEILGWFPLWWAGLMQTMWRTDLHKNSDFGCRPRFGSQLCLFFSLIFSGAFALRICTRVLCWIAGERPYEEQLAGITMCPDIGRQSTWRPDVRSLKAWKTGYETFVKGLWKSSKKEFQGDI